MVGLPVVTHALFVAQKKWLAEVKDFDVVNTLK